VNAFQWPLAVAILSLGGVSMPHNLKVARAQVPAADQQATAIVSWYESEIRPLEIESSRLWWSANTTGDDKAYEQKEQAENRLNEALADKTRFAQLKKLHEQQLSDPVVARQIELVYLTCLGKQLDPALMARMTAKANAIEKAFNAYRAKVGSEELSDSQVRKILLESTDSAERRRVWEASKTVGRAVERDVRDLLLLRNEAARQLGFANYHAMMLRLNEQDPAATLRLFDELNELTREPFLRAKAQIDAKLAESYGVAIADLMPWHYHDPFFQESPNVFNVNLDETFAQTDVIDICRRFYAGIGLPIDDVISRSDLYEKPGKSPHAFCTDIDREGDVRVLANIVPNAYWMGTMMHELGHSVYSSKNMPRTVPYLLRSEAHILTTEGIAMMFERFPANADWLEAMGLQVADPDAYDQAARLKRRNQLLIFSRWCQVMFRFEMSMYDNPDQNLNELWWGLVETYQGLRRPPGRNEPDYASKIHIVSAPCYYHNYMMGELFACQLHAAITRDVLSGGDPTGATYHENPAVGRFLTEKVFAPGRLFPWNELTQLATGSELKAEAFALEFAK
jgi:peptidyl-dipeptidase A